MHHPSRIAPVSKARCDPIDRKRDGDHLLPHLI
jgi:hypothetical protein